MNILIIGNGFDLAHGLPTKYTDFLAFIEKMKTLKTWGDTPLEFKERHLDNSNVHPYIKTYIGNVSFKAYNDDEMKSHVNELYNIIENNFWINYFSRIEYKNENWIDFEKEILLAIKFIEQLFNFNKEDKIKLIRSGKVGKEQLCMKNNIKENIFEPVLITTLKNTIKHGSSSDIENISEHKSEIISIMEKDLLMLIRALEIYLLECVDPIKLKPLPIFSDYHFEKMISFNYTSTYAKVYDSESLDYAYLFSEYEHIHGRALKESSLETNNMVLGIDDYKNGTSASDELDFIRFKKYFQRIVKKTGCSYKKWMEANEEKNIFIFGHSLDITDKDILADIINASKTKTTIFYQDKKDFEQKVINLIKILGRDEVIKKVYDGNLIFSLPVEGLFPHDKNTVSTQKHYV